MNIDHRREAEELLGGVYTPPWQDLFGHIALHAIDLLAARLPETPPSSAPAAPVSDAEPDRAPADIAALLAEVEQAERARARAVVQLGEVVTRAESAEDERDAALERLAKVEAALDEAAVTRVRAALGGEDA